MIMTTEQTTFLRECIARDRATGYLGSYTAGGVEDLLDTIDSLRAEVQRLTEEAREYRALVAAVDDAKDAEIAKLRNEARRSDAGRVEVPEPMDVEVEVELSKWWPVAPGWRVGFSRGVEWARKNARLSPSPQPATGTSEEWVPVLQEAFADNGEHSHWNLFDPKTGELLWTEAPEEEWHKHHRRPSPQPSADVVEEAFRAGHERGCLDGVANYHGEPTKSVTDLFKEWDALRSSTNHDAQDAGEGR